MKSLVSLEKKIPQCRKCSRLVRYLAEIKAKFPTYWCRPVPGFGDPNAQILLIGLAPGRFGSNRTGRMFTGDASGNFLYPVLHKVGLATKPVATDLHDGLKLKNTFITAVARCAPPQNKPKPQEIKNCRPYLEKELKLLSSLRVVVALGKIAHDEYLRIRVREEGKRLSDFPFRHGVIYHFRKKPKILIDTYHPSRQNTNTGKLTKAMFLKIFKQAARLASDQTPPLR